MRRWRRMILMALLLAGAAGGVAWGLRRGQAPARLRLGAQFPTTRSCDQSNTAHFGTIGRAPFVVVPPDLWYGFGAARMMPLGGDLTSGLARWVGPTISATGTVARGDGMIFISTLKAGIQALDESSRALIMTITPPAPVKDLIWVNGLVIGSGLGSVHAFDPADGKLLWTHNVKSGLIETAVSADGERIYFGTTIRGPFEAPAQPMIVALNFRDGQALWRAPLPQPPFGAPASDGLTIYCTSRDQAHPFNHAVTAFDARTGQKKWDATDFAPVVATDSRLWNKASMRAPAVGDGTVCVSLNLSLCGIEAASGKLVWQWFPRNPPFGRMETDVGPPLIRGGFAFVTIKQGICAVDCKTGQEVWRYRYTGRSVEILNPDRDTPPMIAGNLLVMFFLDGAVHGVRLPVAPEVPSTPTAAPIKPTLLCTGLALLIIASIGAFYLHRVRAMVAMLSLALCVLTFIAWLSSFNAKQFLGVKAFGYAGKHISESATGITSSQGGLSLGKVQIVRQISIKPMILGDPSSTFWYTRLGRTVLANGVCVEEPSTDLNLLRFAWTHRARTSGTPLGNQAETSLTLPHWVVVLVLAIAPLAWLGGFWQDRQRYPAGHCVSCGYDLRASSGRCPECGATTTTALSDALGKPSG